MDFTLITPELFRKCSKEKNIQFWIFSRCTNCGEAYGFHFFIYPESEVVLDSSCDCTEPIISSWEEVVKKYNEQPENVKIKFSSFFGFNLT